MSSELVKVKLIHPLHKGAYAASGINGEPVISDRGTTYFAVELVDANQEEEGKVFQVACHSLSESEEFFGLIRKNGEIEIERDRLSELRLGNVVE